MANVDFGNHYKRFVRYFWDPEPKNDDPSMSLIWCLGREYSAEGHEKPEQSSATTASLLEVKQEPDGDAVLISNGASRDEEHSNWATTTSTRNAGAPTGEDLGWPRDFLKDFESRFWFTYRSDFPPIKRSSDTAAAPSITLAVRLRSQFNDQGAFTSDTGWGCMIRSGQCLIANGLGILRLGRNWRRGVNVIEERHLITLFADDPRAPFSIHRFVEHGALACGKHPGEWFGPSATSRCIQALSHAESNLGLKVYINGDGPDVYEDSFLRLARDGNGNFCPTLILVGVRLGIDRVTPVYREALTRSLQMSQCVGIAGGRPSASHYFVGVQGDNFFYLDPHQTRTMLSYRATVDEVTKEDVDSCHTQRLRRLHIDQMDPSMLLAFLIRDEADWASWKSEMMQFPGKHVIHIAAKEPVFDEQSGRDGAVDEVEAFDEDENEEDGELINIPTCL